ncbi:hypothetical protein L1049_015686 [Liquidambar formosana]|uniref:Uncharacterized protein n=1 Tax=Liquidambar formosana TaxID=63359 RepID=A0AAP0X6A0_LIQFO
MASSPLNSKTRHHARSISLPTRSHPLIPKFNEHLCRLKASEACSPSSTSIGHELSGVADLHDCVDGLLILPLTQLALAQESHRKWVDDLLDGSLRLFDVCSTARDALSQTKEHAQELQSIFRRRRGNEVGIAKEVGEYLSCRKNGEEGNPQGLEEFERY